MIYIEKGELMSRLDGFQYSQEFLRQKLESKFCQRIRPRREKSEKENSDRSLVRIKRKRRPQLSQFHSMKSLQSSREVQHQIQEVKEELNKTQSQIHNYLTKIQRAEINKKKLTVIKGQIGNFLKSNIKEQRLVNEEI